MDEPKRYKLTKKEIDGMNSIQNKDLAIKRLFENMADMQTKIFADDRKWWSKVMKRIKANPDKEHRYESKTNEVVERE